MEQGDSMRRRGAGSEQGEDNGVKREKYKKVPKKNVDFFKQKF